MSRARNRRHYRSYPPRVLPGKRVPSSWSAPLNSARFRCREQVVDPLRLIGRPHATMALNSSRHDARVDLEHPSGETVRRFAWLADSPRPLDWNGPVNRLLTRLRDEDLQRPMIERFERVARRQPDHVAIRDASGVVTFGQLWDGVS